MEQPDAPTGSYGHAAGLAEAGRYEEALAAVLGHLDQSPDDGRALNDAGAILYALGRPAEAIEYLRRAASVLGPERGQALWNLAEALLAVRPSETLGLFDVLESEGLLTADLANRTAAACLDSGDPAAAIEALIRSFRMSPGQDVLLPIYERVRALRPKVAFFCEFDDTKFIKDIYAFVNARFESRLLRGQSAEETRRLMAWCDIAWFEWCTGQVVTASLEPKVCRSVVRLHRFEAYTPLVEQVRWENIDALITVGNPAILERVRRRVPDIERRTRVLAIPNGVNLERFVFRDRPRGKNLACVGYINMRKSPILLLQAFCMLHRSDPQYRLFFAGNFPNDDFLEDYLRFMVRQMGLEGSVFFDGWQDDVASWLQDKHYLVTASVSEGHPVGVLEGMASGLKPVVHAFPGCCEFLPDAYMWRTVDEFCRRILTDPYRPAEYREFVETRFPLKVQLGRINDLFLELERSRIPKSGGAALARAAAPGIAGGAAPLG